MNVRKLSNFLILLVFFIPQQSFAILELCRIFSPALTVGVAKPTEIIAQTERLVIRTLEASDYRKFKEIYLNPEVAAMSKDGYPPEFVDVKFSAAMKGLPEGAWSGFAAGVFEKGKMIGVIEFHSHRARSPGIASLGYSFHPSAWNQKFASEAGAAFVKFGFEKLGLHMIRADAAISNGASNRVLEKLGFKKTGENVFHRGGEAIPSSVYELRNSLEKP